MSEAEEVLSCGTSDKRIARYTALLTGSGIVCKLLLLVFTALAADILGRELYGQLEYLIEMALIFGVLIDFGLEQTLTRDLAKWKDRFRSVAEATLGFRFLTSLLAFVSIELVLSVIDLAVRDRIYVLENGIAGVYCVVIFQLALGKALLRSRELLPAEAKINLVDRGLLVLIGIAALWLGGGVPVLLGVYVLTACVALFLAWWTIARRVVSCRPRLNIGLAVQWQRTAIPIGLSAACILLLHRQDTAMVNIIAGNAETGVYKAAYRPFEGLFLFPQMLAISCYPIVSALHAGGERIERLVARFLRLLFFVSVPMAVGGTAIADSFIGQIYPEYHPDSVSVLIILVWSLPCIFGNFLLGTILNATNRQTKNFYASAIAMAANFVFNIPAILYFGADGAALVTILSQGLYFVLILVYCRDVMEWSAVDLKRSAGMLVSAAMMAVVLIVLPLAWYSEFVIGAAVYGVAMIVLRAVVREDLELILSARGR